MLEKTLASLKSELETKDAERSRVLSLVEEKSERIRSLEADLVVMNERLAAVQREFWDSTSWKVTAPLRKLLKRIRGIGGRRTGEKTE